MKIALVSDWLPTFGGAEHVIAEFHRLWPQAPIFTTIANKDDLGPLSEADIRTTKLQWVYKLIGKHRFLLPLMPRAVENIDLSGFEVILSSSHAVGKGIIPPANSTHICYCHTPMRYAWEMEDQYLNDSKIPKRWHRHVRNLLKKLRRWDNLTAKRVDFFIANSTTTRERIKRIYNRESTVITPPVDEMFLKGDIGSGTGDYYLSVGRMVPYKRFDLLIETANKFKLPLIIAGTGPDFKKLLNMAGKTVIIKGFVDHNDLPDLYKNAKALLFPQLEDAGVVPLEAQACSAPVICFGQGGVLDTVKNGETGLYFEAQTVESLKDAIDRFEKMKFDRKMIREHAWQFSADNFRKKIERFVKETVTPLPYLK